MPMHEIGHNGFGTNGFTEEKGVREALQALGRRKWLILSTFVVTAAALWAAYPVSQAGVCLVAVKKPSQVFVVGKEEILPSASVPLLEGQTYKDMVNSVAFATQVATAFSR